ncbi:MAG: DNA polymerase I [Methylocystaceae bacterium]
MSDRSRETIMVIDGNSLAYRAFYALPGLTTGKGVPTSAVYGFLTMFFKVYRQYNPDYLVVAFDKDKKTLRHDLFADYKATRKATPPELRQQFTILREVLTALKVPILEQEGFEADDLIGSVASTAAAQAIDCLVVTGDQDALQLVSANTRVILNRKGITETDFYDPQLVMEKWEVPPEMLIEVKALMGDTSDNIPGVPSVGKKTAIKLVRDIGRLEEIYDRINEVSGVKLRQALVDNREQAYMSRDLARIRCDVDLALDWDQCRVGEPDYEHLIELYRELEFTGFLNELKQSQPVKTTAAEVSRLTPLEFAAALLPAPVAVWVKADRVHPMLAEIEAFYFAQEERVCALSYSGDDRELLTKWLADAALPKIVHNAKFLEVICRRENLKLAGISEDSLLLSYCVESSFSGESLSEHITHFLGSMADENLDPEAAVAQLPPLVEHLHAKAEPEALKIYHEVELPLSSVLAAMEFRGILVDEWALRELSEEMDEVLTRVTREIFDFAGEPFNLNSPRQLGTVLFETLKLPAKKKTKTGYSTSAEVLEDLYDAHPIIPLIMEYRTVAKLKTTYVDALPHNINPLTGRVHTIFKQAVTATGRLSSVEPNLQNIPIRNQQGERIRRAFIAAPGKVLLAADYSQIDLRVLAHMSEDENLIKAFVTGEDVHTSTAASIFRVAPGEVTPVLRRRAKAVNFGIVYGISDFGLARDTGVTRYEAHEYIENYLNNFPGVRRYMREIVETGRRQGYVATILGRRRYLPDLLASNYQVRSMAERMALNTPIQGSSADIIKLAMLKIDEQLKADDFPADLLLQVHDELIYEVNEELAAPLAQIVRQSMEGALTLKVPLEVSIETGYNWQDMKEWD